MSLPNHLAVTHEKYSHLLFLPLGRKHKQVRSFGHKHTRSILSRIDTAVQYALESLSEAQLDALLAFTNGRLPLPIDREESVSPYLWKPDTFLWKTFSLQRGVPLKQEQMYNVNILQASKQELMRHLQTVIEDYAMIGQIAGMQQDQFIQHITAIHRKHPFILLYQQYEQELQALPLLQKAPFLFALRDQERVAFWRERQSVMMRPFQAVPLRITHTGAEEMEISFHSPHIKLTFPKQGISFFYQPFLETITFLQDIDIPLVQKRVQSVISGFHSLMEDNAWLLERLTAMQKLQETVRRHETDFTNLQQLYKEACEAWPVPEPPLLSMLARLQGISIPAGDNMLVRLSQVRLPDISMLTKWPEFSAAFAAEWARLPDTAAALRQITAMPMRPPASVSEQTAKNILAFLAELQPATPALLSALQGNATRANRTLGYTELPAFGLLHGCKETDILHILQEMAQLCLISKHGNTFAVTEKGIAYMQT